MSDEEGLGETTRDELVGSWAGHVQEMLIHYGFSVSASDALRIADGIADEVIAGLDATSKHRAGHRQRAEARTTILSELAAGRSQVEAASRAGVSVETFHRWRREDPSFRKAADRARREAPALTSPRRRPLKMTASVQQAILQQLRAGMTRSQAAASVGISRQTLYAWLRKLPEFAEAVHAAEDRAARERLGTALGFTTA